MGAECSTLLTKHFKQLRKDRAYASNAVAQEETLNKLFDMLDCDGNGGLDADELPALVQGIRKAYKNVTNKSLDQGLVQGIIGDADTNGDKFIDRKEFFLLMEQIHLLLSETIGNASIKMGVAQKLKLRTSKLSDSELDQIYHARPLDELLATLNTGDVLLFRGNGATSQMIKKLTFCCFSHVAMVLRNPSPAIRQAYSVTNETEEVFIFESNASTQPARPRGGTHIVPLRWKLERAVRKEEPNYLLCVRSLTIPNSKGLSDRELFPELEEFILKMNNVSYEMQQLDMLASTSYVGALGMKEDLNSVFCTELLAAAYKRMGLLSSKFNPTKALPRTFTSNQRLVGKLPLKRGATLAPEIRIRCTRSQEELVAEFNAENPEKIKADTQLIPQELQVEIHDGENLLKDRAKIKVVYRSFKAKTKVQKGKGTSQIVWQEKIMVPLTCDWKDPSEDGFLSFSVFKPNRPEDKFLGMGYVDLSALDVTSQKELEESICLNTQGTLRVSFRLVDK